jgi:polar amino acid transport system permease protein
VSHSSGADAETPLAVLKLGHRAPEQVVELVRKAQSRRRLRFRLTFVATWVVLVGGLVGLLMAGGRLDPAFMLQWAPYILGGVPVTLFISLASIVLAIVLAILGALGRLSSVATIYAAATLYVSLMRGTPLLVQILFVYLALPQVFPAAADIPLLALGIAALALNYGAYMTEIFRAGIQAVPRGQREAGEALGMRDRLILRRIVLPQAIRIVTPAIGNEFIAMTKDSALVSVIGIQELLWRAQRIGSANFRTFETLLIAALVYWVMTIFFSFFQDRLEKRLARGDR